MTGSLLFCIALAYFVAAYFIYGRYLTKVFAIDPKRPTPAHTQYDGIDFVPAPRAVIFGHHFASIAGPGPIVGPVMAAYFGWLPALIWILIGCVFVGALHDFAALVISVRNRGHSISFVMEKMMGLSGRQLFLGFCLACLVLVIAVFTNMVASMFVNVPAVATASVAFVFMAPAFAYFINRLGVRLLHASLIAVPMVFLMVPFGSIFPIDFTRIFGVTPAEAQRIWLGIIVVYIFIASVMPVHWLLQPRDYMNSWLLYGTLILGLLSILVYNPDIKMDTFKGWQAITADGNLSSLFPTLFIFIACGACSGFHALIGSGTTSKQIRSESDMLPVGYGAMLIEGILGVMTLVVVMNMDVVGVNSFAELGKNPVHAFAVGMSQFFTSLGIDQFYSQVFLSLAISSFVITSLDTAARLGRFLMQELFMPRAIKGMDDEEEVVRKALREGSVFTRVRKIFLNKFVAAFAILGLSTGMALSGSAAVLWPIFGASNQLVAGLTFLVITLWLLTRNVNWIIAFIPMMFMIVMSMWGVTEVIRTQWGRNTLLVGTGFFLCIMGIMMVALGLTIISHHIRSHVMGREASA